MIGIMDRQLDSYEVMFSQDEEDLLIREVAEMERNSSWEDNICSSGIRLKAIDDRPIFAEQDSDYYETDPELTVDTGVDGTGLVIDPGTGFELVRNTAMTGIENVAKLNGSALGRMPRSLYAETMNNAFSVAKGRALMLMRYGKCSALHSDADGGYMIMPIHKLLDISADTLCRRFGNINMRFGYNSHGFTQCTWTLPDAQDRLVDMYQGAVHNTSGYAMNFMPAVQFQTSDTSSACASLYPKFILPNGASVRFVDGIKVKHTKRGGSGEEEKNGLDIFKDESEKIFAKFEETAEVIEKLSEIRIYNACNCVVGLCGDFKIARKWGDAARQEAERLSVGLEYITAHDVYLCLTMALAAAQEANARAKVISDMEESLMRMLKSDYEKNFTKNDVSGLVAWRNTA